MQRARRRPLEGGYLEQREDWRAIGLPDAPRSPDVRRQGGVGHLAVLGDSPARRRRHDGDQSGADRRVTAPAEVVEISAKDWRKRRKAASRAGR